MKTKIYCNTHPQCKECPILPKGEFRYIEKEEGKNFQFTNEKYYTLVFILHGGINLSCNQFIDIPFHAGEMCIIPVSARCIWNTLENTEALILSGEDYLNQYDKIIPQLHAEDWLNSKDSLEKLKIRKPLKQFLSSVKTYLDDGLTCPALHQALQYQLSLLFRAYYSQEEIINFFAPMIKHNREFELFIMNNYLKMKGVKEFVDLSGLSLSVFNRKFKAHFGESPYQWMIKQKSKHIMHELLTKNKSISSIIKEFNFSDASHFNKYCKSMFGASPSEIRKHKTVIDT